MNSMRGGIAAFIFGTLGIAFPEASYVPPPGHGTKRRKEREKREAEARTELYGGTPFKVEMSRQPMRRAARREAGKQAHRVTGSARNWRQFVVAP